MSSTYLTTDRNRNISIPNSSVYLSFQKLTKFNRFYLSKNKLSYKAYQLNPSSIKKYTYKNSFISTNHQTPLKITKVDSLTNASNSKYLNTTTNSKSYKTIHNKSIFASPKATKKFNPDILETQYISLPKKMRKKIKLDIPKCNTFLADKIKKRPLNLNIFDYINGYNLNITPRLINKPFIHHNIKDIRIKNKIDCKGNNSISDSMKLLINRKNKSCKKSAKSILKFKQRLRFDRRDNMNEYNDFMHSLRSTLSRSKSKSYSRNFVYY